MAERLQDDRARRIGADRLLLDVDPAVAQVRQFRSNRFPYPRGDIDTYRAGSSPLAANGRPTGGRKDGIMGLFRRSKHAARTSRKPTLRERRAAERTARAEASLVETEQKIHEIADEVRGDLKGSA